jgi:hypothetical protein
MSSSPFRTRVAIERAVVKLTNEYSTTCGFAPLHGLSTPAIRRSFPDDTARLAKAQRVRDLLVDMAIELRTASSSSHRGDLQSPLPAPRDVEAFLSRLRKSLDETGDKAT